LNRERESFWSSRAIGKVAPTFSTKGLFNSGLLAVSIERIVKSLPPWAA
jgi:hypothetical protein